MGIFDSIKKTVNKITSKLRKPKAETPKPAPVSNSVTQKLNSIRTQAKSPTSQSVFTATTTTPKPVTAQTVLKSSNDSKPTSLRKSSSSGGGSSSSLKGQAPFDSGILKLQDTPLRPEQFSTTPYQSSGLSAGIVGVGIDQNAVRKSYQEKVDSGAFDNNSGGLLGDLFGASGAVGDAVSDAKKYGTGVLIALGVVGVLSLLKK